MLTLLKLGRFLVDQKIQSVRKALQRLPPTTERRSSAIPDTFIGGKTLAGQLQADLVERMACLKIISALIAELEAAVANEAMFGHFDDDDLPEKWRAEGGIIALRRAAEALGRA